MASTVGKLNMPSPGFTVQEAILSSSIHLSFSRLDRWKKHQSETPGCALRCRERCMLHHDCEAKGICCCCRPLQLAEFCPPFIQICSRRWGEEEEGEWEAGQMNRKKCLILTPVVLIEQSLCSCGEECWAAQEFIWTLWTIRYVFLLWAGVPSLSSSSSSLEVEVGVTVDEPSLSSSGQGAEVAVDARSLCFLFQIAMGCKS